MNVPQILRALATCDASLAEYMTELESLSDLELACAYMSTIEDSNLRDAQSIELHARGISPWKLRDGEQ